LICPSNKDHDRLEDFGSTCSSGKTGMVIEAKFFCYDCERMYKITSKGFNDTE